LRDFVRRKHRFHFPLCDGPNEEHLFTNQLQCFANPQCKADDRQQYLLIKVVALLICNAPNLTGNIALQVSNIALRVTNPANVTKNSAPTINNTTTLIENTASPVN
jgi:hypothetical protein